MKIKNHIILLAASLLAAGFTSCDSDDSPAPEKSKYVYDIPQTNLDRDVVVGAYYTNIKKASDMWTKGHWGTSPLGEYLSTNVSTLEQQLKWADEAGLDFMLVAYDASSDDKKLLTNLSKARANVGAKARIALNYSTKHLGATDTAPLQTEANMKKLTDEFTSTIIPLFESDDYYKFADGTPYIMVTPVNLSSTASNSIDYAEVLPALREHCESLGWSPYIVGEFTTGWAAPVNYTDNQLRPFDGLTLNDWKTNVLDKYMYFFSFIDLNWANWVKSLAEYNTDFVPCIFPSYNDRPNSSSSYYYVFGVDGDTADYINFCNVAKRNLGSRDVVLVNSWNNFLKGTGLEPTEENKGEYITVTRQQFKLN